MAIIGGCVCGKVTYRIEGKLRDARSCHCSRCRKTFSSQASAYAEIDPATFQWQSGEDLLTTFETAAGFGLQFCSVCGSTLCGIYQGGIHGVTLGCVDGDPEVEIGMHIHVGSKAAWEVMPDNVTQFQERPAT